MRLVDLAPQRGAAITEYQSRGASAQALADGRGESHVYAIHFAPGGQIGPHPAGFAQLFCAVSGTGWVAGADGVRHAVCPGQVAVIANGEVHAKGSDAGLTALMVQISDLTTPGAG